MLDVSQDCSRHLVSLLAIIIFGFNTTKHLFNSW